MIAHLRRGEKLNMNIENEMLLTESEDSPVISFCSIVTLRDSKTLMFERLWCLDAMFCMWGFTQWYVDNSAWES